MSSKKKIVDDGHTIYNMDVEGLPKRSPKSQRIILSNKERLALIKVVILKYIPLLFGVILCFGIALLLIYIWLN